MLEVTDLGCVRGDRRLFSDVNFTLSSGSYLQVQGPNGSGKTSLLRLICGLLTPSEGDVRWQGANIHSLGEDYFTSLSYIGHRNGLKEELSPDENLRFTSGLAGIAVSRAEAKRTLAIMGLAGREHLPARLLSEGQRRRTALARLMTCETSLWVLDEVLTSLDSSAVRFVTSLLEEHLNKGGIAVVATHHELDLSANSYQQLNLAS
ncbi:MAG: cytochrome c biogenesis heme-transporting ATPase CcmA [Pyrinomonadaceae bacterium]|jgi:heme exporter protein A|nr:cytochrome c biogenesis heme-transporting ATPase CcmA [Pyrinomonadaceae bacterium]